MRNEKLDKPWIFQWDAIHFNVGMHDLTMIKPEDKASKPANRTSIEQYKKNLKGILTYLEELASRCEAHLRHYHPGSGRRQQAEKNRR